MKRLVIKFIIIIALLYIGERYIGIIDIDSTAAAIGFALVLLLINMTIKPLLLIISLPVTLITLGLFSLVINTWMIMLAEKLIDGINIRGFWNALLFALSFSLLNEIIVYNKNK